MLRPVIVWLICLLVCGLLSAMGSSAASAEAGSNDPAAPCEPILRVTDPDHDLQARRVGLLPYDPSVDLLETWIGHDDGNVTIGARVAQKPPADKLKQYLYWVFFQAGDSANHTSRFELVIAWTTTYDSAEAFDEEKHSLGDFNVTWNGSAFSIRFPVSLVSERVANLSLLGSPFAAAQGPYPGYYGSLVDTDYWSDRAGLETEFHPVPSCSATMDPAGVIDPQMSGRESPSLSALAILGIGLGAAALLRKRRL